MATHTAQEMDIPVGSTVLVTGATGFIASHVINQLLNRGFKVRGSVRDFHSSSWLITAHLNEVRTGQLELVKVPDMGVDDAFDEAVVGVSAIIHLATSTAPGEGGGFETDPEIVIPVTVKGTTSIFLSALKEKSIKKFVFTGSIVAATFPVKGLDTEVKSETFNEAAVEAAYSAPPHGPIHGFYVYAAGKVAAEKEFLSLMEKHKPRFSGNIVSPSGVIGEPQHVKHADVHHNWVTSLYRSERQRLEPFPCAYFIDVKDIAFIHVGAVLDPEVQNERLQAWGRSLNWNIFLQELRKLRPQKQWIEDFPEPGFLDITTDQKIAEALLQKWGQKSWTPLEQTLADNLNNPYFQLGVGK
ncbi:NAD dependent epimerase/dehydratase family protein [Sarocladium implicatum]|nr:NAD dependent epimerase/dehydratase family protein [Sarocladium implicatum]